MNKIILMGRLTKDPVIRYSQGETPVAVARFTLAVNRRYKREGEQDADFIICLAFGKTAEFFEKYGRQGVKFIVEGRIQTGSYMNKEGQKIYTTEVVVENTEFAESKNSSGNAETTGVAGQPVTVDDGFMNITEGIDDGELPFK